MKAHTVANISLLILWLGVSGHAAWGVLLFFLSLTFAIYGVWRIPGGFAWRRAVAPPRGPAGWPIIGSIPIMGALAHRRLAELADSYGASKLMALSLGPSRVVISSDPETAREILQGPSFADRPAKESARLLMFERAIGFSPSGEYWLKLRRLAATNLFCPRRIASLEGLRQKVAEGMIDRVGEEMGKRGAVELRGVLQRGSLESVLGSLFGVMIGSKREKDLVEMVKEGYDLIGAFNLEDHFPTGGLLDFHGVAGRCKKLSEKVKTLFGELIEERRNSGEPHGDDFLSVLLSLPREEALSDDDITAVLWEMIFRGTDVVAVVLEWAMARMAMHQEIQAKVHQEIADCLAGASRPIQDADMPRLPYLQAVMKEILRLHPPGPLLSWARLAVNDVHVDKVLVPAGTTAMVNMWAITHNGSIWKEPWSFKPERFMEETVPVMGSDLRLAPFGAGRRVCPGRALGLATINLWFARLLQSNSWFPARPVVLTECLRLSMEMKKPLVCRAVPR